MQYYQNFCYMSDIIKIKLISKYHNNLLVSQFNIKKL